MLRFVCLFVGSFCIGHWCKCVTPYLPAEKLQLILPLQDYTTLCESVNITEHYLHELIINNTSIMPEFIFNLLAPIHYFIDSRQIIRALTGLCRLDEKKKI